MNEMEQLCEVGIAELRDSAESVNNALAVSVVVESTYKALHNRAKSLKRVLVGVSQTVTMQGFSANGEHVALYVVTLVGTAVDEEVIKQQQRQQQFDPRLTKPSRLN